MMNTKMRLRLVSLEQAALSKNLADLAKQGFLACDGAYVLRGLAKPSALASRKVSPDLTGYECFVNHIHIDDFTERNQLANAISFTKEVFKSWRAVKPDLRLVGIIAENSSGVTVRFHHLRVGESWLADDLESYEEAILVAHSNLDSMGYADLSGQT